MKGKERGVKIKRLSFFKGGSNFLGKNALGGKQHNEKAEDRVTLVKTGGGGEVDEKYRISCAKSNIYWNAPEGLEAKKEKFIRKKEGCTRRK